MEFTPLPIACIDVHVQKAVHGPRFFITGLTLLYSIYRFSPCFVLVISIVLLISLGLFVHAVSSDFFHPLSSSKLSCINGNGE